MPRREHFKWNGTHQVGLSATEFRQMAGRAGRAGIDDAGEAVLIAPEGDKSTLAALHALIMVKPASSSTRGAFYRNPTKTQS